MKGFVEATEQDFARLLALQQFLESKKAEKQASFQDLEAMRQDLHSKDALLEKAADDLFRIHGELKFAK
jgi:peptidoglycan hydrolase CwlO-like protein